jgi:phenylacetate-coenzyme A ligase PaaK-like adenylate-forming protein
MHIADDLVILEPVDGQGRAVPYGQPADRVLLTNLYNLDQPLIRYDLADALTITDAPCPCGCAHRRITEVRARMNGAYDWPGSVSVPCREIETTLLDSPGIAEFLVGPTDRGLELSVVATGSYDSERARGDLVELLARHGMASAEVEVSEMREPERLWSGKVRQFRGAR